MGIKTKLIFTSVAIKLLIFGSQYLVDQAYEDYDQSKTLLFQDGEVSKLDQVLSLTARWDSMFFLKIAQEGYEYEKNHAFFETYPKILNFISKIFKAGLQMETITGLLLSGFLLNLTLNSLNTVLLYEITRLKFPEMGNKFHYAVCLIYQFSPSSAFYNAIYSESLFSFLIFSYLFLFYREYYAIPEDQRGTKLFASISDYSFSLLPSIVLSTSVFVRSNGIFWVVVVGYPILEAFVQNLITYTRKGLFSLAVMVNTVAWGIFNLIIILIPYALVLKRAESVYCSPSYFEENASWCQAMVPNVYGFIQDKHWNVGFLTYYKFSRVFFIVWGVYTFILIGSSLFNYLRSLIRKPEHQSIFSNGEMHSQMIYTSVLFLISVFFAHSQSSTRFFSSDPNLYWFIAEILFNHSSEEISCKIPKILAIAYLVHNNIAGIFLYSNYLSWT